MKRDPSATSDWAVQHSSWQPTTTENTHHSVTASLLAPSTDDMARPETRSGRGSRPADLEVGFNYRTTPAKLFDRPNEGPDATPEQWENISRPHGNFDPTQKVDQGVLFQRPTQTAGKIEYMRATKAASRRIGTGLGVLQNEADRLGVGALREGSEPDLSQYSSHLVGKLTGREHAITNDYDFFDDEDDYERNIVSLPRQGEGNEFSSITGTNTKILTRGEANMGLDRFRQHLAESPAGQERTKRREDRKRSQGPTYTQGELF